MPKTTSWFPSMIFILCLLMLNSCKNKTSAPNLESLALPTFYPPEGLYNDTQYVVLSCITPNATIYYTSDNSEPGLNTEQYVNPIEINTGTTIKCKAYKDGYQASATAIATYMINVPDPPETSYWCPGDRSTTVALRSVYPLFYIDKFELTQADCETVMGINPSHFQDEGQDPGRPVERVSWFNAIEYCNRRSILEGLNPCL